MSNSITAGLQSLMLPTRLQPAKTSSGTEPAVDPADTPEQKFLDYAKKSPAEKIRDALLASVGVTEDQLKAMSPDQRREIEQKIADKVKQEVEKKAANGGSASGFFTDIKA